MADAPQITDWITAGSAIVAASSAVWYTVVTRGLLKAQQRQVAIQQEQLEDARRMLAAERRPNLVMRTLPWDTAYVIEVRNSSGKLATAIKLRRPYGEVTWHVADSLAFGESETVEIAPGRDLLELTYSNEFGEQWTDEWNVEEDSGNSNGHRLVRRHFRDVTPHVS